MTGLGPDAAVRASDDERRFAALCGMSVEEYVSYRDMGRTAVSADTADADVAAAAKAANMTPEEYAAHQSTAGAQAWALRHQTRGAV